MTVASIASRNASRALDELATPRLPDYADDLLPGPRPRASDPSGPSSKGGSRVQHHPAVRVPLPPIPWRLGVAVALLAIAALVAALVAGSLLASRAAPMALQATARSSSSTQDGAIVAGDPVTGDTMTLVAGARRRPIRSTPRTGDRFAFTRSAGMRDRLFVADFRRRKPVQL